MATNVDKLIGKGLEISSDILNAAYKFSNGNYLGAAADVAKIGMSIDEIQKILSNEES